MYRILNFYIIVFLFFLKINSKIVKYRMMVLTKKEKADMFDVNVTLGCVV
jgi:hypothetical protein